MARLLFVDEDAKTLNVFSTLLRTEGYKVVPVLGLDKSMRFVKAQQFDLIILDISQNPDAGIDLLASVRNERPDIPIIVIRDDKCPKLAPDVSSMESVYWVEKPLRLHEFLLNIQKVVDYQNSTAVVAGAPVVEMAGGIAGIVARSSAMCAVAKMIKRIAPAEIAILIHGEEGLDKELIAKAIHESSLCREGQFVHFDCSAFPDESKLNLTLFGSARGKTASASGVLGLFETSKGGTLFLDNVDALPVSVQGKVNDVLQKKKVRREGGDEDIPVSVRVIASTSENLEKKARAGAFHEGLYRCLSLMPIELKPLRDCREDIAPLVEQVLHAESSAEKGPLSCDNETLSILERYPWPGNLEELREVIRGAAKHASGNIITQKDLPQSLVLAARMGAGS